MKSLKEDPRLFVGLRHQIKRFYDRLNRRQFERCYNTTDPDFRFDSNGITLAQYHASGERFMEWCGRFKIHSLEVARVITRGPSAQYKNRAFAFVNLTWKNGQGRPTVSKIAGCAADAGGGFLAAWGLWFQGTMPANTELYPGGFPMEEIHKIESKMKGSAEDKQRRAALLLKLEQAFASGGQEAVTNELTQRFNELEAAFNTELNELVTKL